MADSQPETFEAESSPRKPGPQRRLEYFLGDRFPQIDGEDYVLLASDDILVKYLATDDIPE